jgi:hypothetical protein
MSNCPQCKRPYNTGNSPNRYECHDFDDGEDSVCYAYSEVAKRDERLVAMINIRNLLVDIKQTANSCTLREDQGGGTKQRLFPFIARLAGEAMDILDKDKP